MPNVRSESFFVVHGWMVNNLKLTGCELETFAIVYGFCQDGESEYHGSVSYIADFLCTTRQAVTRALNRLCGKGILKKTSRPGGTNCYKVDMERVINYNTTCNDSSHPPVTKCNTACYKTLHDNKSIRKKDTETNSKGPFEEFAKDNRELLEALKAFEEMRKTIKKPLTERAKRMVCDKLKKMAEPYIDRERYMVESLEQSTINCYQGVFDVRGFEDNKPEIIMMPDNAFPEWKPGTGQTWEDLVP